MQRHKLAFCAEHALHWTLVVPSPSLERRDRLANRRSPYPPVRQHVLAFGAAPHSPLSIATIFHDLHSTHGLRRRHRSAAIASRIAAPPVRPHSSTYSPSVLRHIPRRQPSSFGAAPTQLIVRRQPSSFGVAPAQLIVRRQLSSLWRCACRVEHIFLSPSFLLLTWRSFRDMPRGTPLTASSFVTADHRCLRFLLLCRAGAFTPRTLVGRIRCLAKYAQFALPRRQTLSRSRG